MLKSFCDICFQEIQPGELVSSFESLEANVFGTQKVKAGQPLISKYLLCSECGKEIKKAIAKLISEKKPHA